MLVFGHGVTSESWANSVAAQCVARGVTCELIEVDEVHAKDLKLYLGLVVVLPTAMESAESVDLFASVINTYRARRRPGLRRLLKGQQDWWEVGVVQVLHDGPVPPPALVHATRGAVCRFLSVNTEADLTPFAAYEAGGQVYAPDPATRPVASVVDPVRDIVTAWGVGWCHDEVADVRRFIDRQRDIYESPRYVDLRRPIPGSPLNRLDYVLDKSPGLKPDPEVCDGTKWTEGGKRVVNRALRELKLIFPDVRRPPDREGRRNLQKEFHEFYAALGVAEEFLRIDS